MSIFNQNTVEESSDWAVEQLYDISEQLCPVTMSPHRLRRKTDGCVYNTIYSLYEEYQRCCVYRFERKKFMDIVKESCKDIVLYKGIIYYRWMWFYERFVDYDRFDKDS